MKTQKTNAIVLSGGKALRLAGQEKAFLKIGPKSLIELKIDFLRPLFSRIILVTNNPADYSHLGVETVADEKADIGPLMGIYCGLKYSGSEYNFVTTCDTPFLQKPLVEHLINSTRGFDVVVPRWNDNLEPLCAVYSTRCLEHIKVTMETKRKVIAFFDKIKVKYVPTETIRQFDQEGMSFFNINTLADYQKALQIYDKTTSNP